MTSRMISLPDADAVTTSRIIISLPRSQAIITTRNLPSHNRPHGSIANLRNNNSDGRCDRARPGPGPGQVGGKAGQSAAGKAVNTQLRQSAESDDVSRTGRCLSLAFSVTAFSGAARGELSAQRARGSWSRYTNSVRHATDHRSRPGPLYPSLRSAAAGPVPFFLGGTPHPRSRPCPPLKRPELTAEGEREDEPLCRIYTADRSSVYQGCHIFIALFDIPGRPAKSFRMSNCQL